ncbi:MAG: apolipoprotein N-acyltransferase [Rhizobiales bacterium]|nr:apolipoprotein N-acyltransferase [Hyphomicrobiales bacterium]
MPTGSAIARGLREFGHSVLLSWGWRRAALATLAGALSALALAPVGAFPVLWLTMPVLVWLVDGCVAEPGAGLRARLGPAFAVGWCFGFGYFLAGLWWIGVAFLAGAESLLWLMPLAVVLLPAGLALFWGAGIALARLFWVDGWPRILVLAVAISLAEWCRGHVLTGFPWNALGYALAPSPLLMQSASLVGLWGLTLLAVLVFAAPALVVGPTARARRGDVAAFVLIAAAFLVHVGFGAVRLALADPGTVDGVRLRLVQPALAQDEKWAGRGDEILSRYLSLSGAGMGEDGTAPFTHLIWPETALPFFLTERPNALAAIGALLPAGTTLITGAARIEPPLGGETEPRYFNSLYVIGDDGTIRDAYDKVHLVPFGEYLPFEHWLRRIGLRQIVALPGGFDPGRRLRTMPLPDAPSFGPLICYEIIFPGAATDGVNRPGWFVNVTNDAWFGDTPGPWQHLQQAVLRSVEEGIPLARAANSGVSAIVDPYGRVQAELKVGEAGVIDGPLPRPLPPTLYSQAGDTIFLLLLLTLAGVAAAGIFTRTKHPN